MSRIYFTSEIFCSFVMNSSYFFVSVPEEGTSDRSSDIPTVQTRKKISELDKYLYRAMTVLSIFDNCWTA
jgi:hypothetical protein